MFSPAVRSAAILLFAALTLVAQAPTIFPGGIVDAATYSPQVVPGSLISIFGSNLAAASTGAAGIPLPTSLGNVSVTVAGTAIPLLYVSPGQINAQLPWEATPGAALDVVVNNNETLSAPVSITAVPFAPGFYTIAGQPLAVNLDGTVAAPAGSIPGINSHPATPGDTVILYASGLGPVNPTGITGSNSSDALRITLTAPAATLSGNPAAVTFSGLSPQFVGVYQINMVVPSTAAVTNMSALQIHFAGLSTAPGLSLAVGAGYPQWAQNSQHANSTGAGAQNLSHLLADIVYDPLVPEEQASNGGELVVHYQVPLIDGNDVYMEFKSGAYTTTGFATENWGENKFSWQNGQLTQVWSFTSDWKAPGSSQDFWEPVFHPVLADDFIYLPGASGSILQLSKATGALLQRIAPFGADPNTYETGPITVDLSGNLYYNAIQVIVDPVNGFYANDAIDSWLVKVAGNGIASTMSYQTLTSPEAPGPTDNCLGTFENSPLPWPPSPTAVPPTQACGTQRVSLNIAPAVAPDGTIYSVTHPQFTSTYAFLVAANPDLTKKWAVSLRLLFNDGCGVPVSAGGWLPANGAPGGCSAGAPLGVDPATNLPGDGLVLDDSSASPTVAPDGSILFGTWSRYNYAQGHLVHFDSNGNYLGAFGFGWDITPAIYANAGSWSAVIKDNHYSGLGSYCEDEIACPPDRTTTNPASPEAYFIAQLNPDLSLAWTYQNTNTNSCSRNPDGSLTCVSNTPGSFEWCVNAPVIDGNGVVYANSEDGNLYAIGQSGFLLQSIFQQLALGAAYTPASIGGDGKVYTQNDGHLFVAGN